MLIQASDVQKLASERSVETRMDVVEKIASGFAGEDFGANEKRIAIEIFRIIVNDVEKKVRQVLSVNLAESMEAPHDVILKLANDIKDVALPVLKNSYVLSENDLIDITRNSTDVEIMSTIAKRDIVSRELSAELIRKSNLTVTETLLRNKNANIDDLGFVDIYEKCANNAPVMELMAKRNSIPATIAEKIFVAVSDEVKKILIKKYNVSFQVANDSAQYARELATLGLVGDEVHKMEMEELVEHLDRNGRLTLSLIIRSLCFGNMRFFEYAMAKLAGISIMNAKILILDRENGFESLYRKTVLPMEMFMAIRYLLFAVLDETALGRYSRNDFRNRLASRLSRDATASKIEYMDYIIMIVQNNMVDYGTTG